MIIGFITFAVGVILFAIGMANPGNNKVTVGAGAVLIIASIVSFFVGLSFKLKENEESQK